MNRKSNLANIVLSALIGLTLVLSAAQPARVSASAQDKRFAAPAVFDSMLDVETESDLSPLTKMSSPADISDASGAFGILDVPQQAGTWPLYFDVVIDEPRHRLYASDWAGNKVDVISTDTLTVTKSFTGLANPRGLALSPDGAELAIANYGVGTNSPVIGSIVFVDLSTDTVSATVIPNAPNPQYNRPWDVIYGRTGRLYSTGNPSSQALDYIHVFDTSTHTEVGQSSDYPVRMNPTMQLSADKNSLYVVEASASLTGIYKYDVTSDTPIRANAGSGIPVSGYLATTFLLSEDGTKLFTDVAAVWGSDLKGKIGSTGQFGNIALLPTRNTIAVAADTASNDAVMFFETDTYYGITAYTLPSLEVIGPIVANSNGSKLFVTSTNGIIAIDLPPTLPGNPIPLPSGSLPYFDVVVDDAHGVLYGSNSSGHKIDVISMDSGQVIDEIRLANGADPRGMDLSPDGSELAVAEFGASSIVFIDTNPLNRHVIASLIPNPVNPGQTTILPWDVLYNPAAGRNRLYATGNPRSYGEDGIHVIDTTTHSEIGAPSSGPRSYPTLGISSDGNVLYVNESQQFPEKIYRYDVSADTLSNPVSTPHANMFSVSRFVVSPNDQVLFTDSGQIWRGDLKGTAGSTAQRGTIALLPAHNAFAVAVDNTGNDAIKFFDINTYYEISSYILPALGTIKTINAASDGSKLFINSGSGIHIVNLTSGIPGTPTPLPSGPLPYFDMELDLGRGVLYGSDFNGHKIDVVSLADPAQILRSYRFVNGASPAGIALSPDGSELAVALYGASEVVFLDPQDGTAQGSVMADASVHQPWDVVYGNGGRVFVTQNTYNLAPNYLHAFDSISRTQIAKSSYSIPSISFLAISADRNSLYFNAPSQSPQKIYKVDVSAGALPNPQTTPHADYLRSYRFLVSPDQNKIYTDSGQVWHGNLKGQVGHTGQAGNLALLPVHNLLAVAVDNAGNDAVSFYSASDYYGVKSFQLPTLGELGPILALPDESKLFLSTTQGIQTIDLSSGVPGDPIPLPSGSQPYFDLILDKARGVLYGSDTLGHKIDVVDMGTLQVLRSYRLVNGAMPAGIALSPDGAELAIAQYGASSILFLNPETGDVIASLMPETGSLIMPWDVIYGRPGRLYSSGNPYSYGLDYIHVVDTTSHTELSKTQLAIRSYPTLAISSDKNSLYVIETRQSPEYLRKLDITTDTIPYSHASISFGSGGNVATFLLTANNSKIFTSTGLIFDSALTNQLGTFTPAGNLAEIPSHSAFLSASGNRITYLDAGNYSQLSYSLLPRVTSSGPVVVKSDDSALFISTDAGIKTVDLPVFPPPPPVPPAAFSKSLPANGATNQSIAPTLSWQTSQGATEYEYCYDTTNDNACASWINNGANTSVTLSGLLPNTTYYWQVRAVNLSGATYANGSGAAFWSFKTAALPASFNKSAPSNNAVKQPTNPTLKWGTSTGATSYEYCYDTVNNNICDTSWIGTAGVSVTLNDLTNNGIYYWQVRAVNHAGITYANSGAWWKFTVVMPPPALLKPADAENVKTRRPTFEWDAVPGATGYTLEVSTAPTFSTKAINASPATNIYTHTSDLAANTVYYWRVKATGTNGPSAYSQVRTFTTGNPPPVPSLVAPANNVLLTNYTPPLDWSDTVPVGGYYELQLATDAAFTQNAINASHIAVSEYAPALSPNTKYYWRVRAYNADDHFSAWSASRYFRTALLPPNSLTPGNVAPGVADNIHTRRPTFEWEAVTGAAGYTLEVSATPAFSTKAITASPTTNTYTHTSDLAANTVYYWRVKATGANGPSAYSQVRTFTTGNPPSIPTLSAPANNALLLTTTPLFDWGNSTVPAGTTFYRYEIQIDTNSAFTSAVSAYTTDADLTDSDYIPSPALSNGATYYWRVRAWNAGVDGNGGNADDDYSGWSAVRSVRIAYAAPALLQPADNALGVARMPYFEWNAIPGALSYTLNVSASPAFATLTINKTIYAPAFSYTHTANLLANTTYYWRVRANGPYGPGAWSVVFQFTTGP